MRYRTIGQNPDTQREVSVLSLGAMRFGTATDEATSYAILDRYVEAGGTFIDTANNYAFWVNGTQGGESEQLIGRWRRNRGIGDEITVATKLGGRPNHATSTFSKDVERLDAKTIRESAERSREYLGTDKLDLLYAHIQDTRVPLEETVEGFAELVAEGTVGLLGASNHWAWRIERARTLAAAAGLPGYEVLQYHHSYLRHRTDQPTLRSPDGNLGVVSGDLLSYLREEPSLPLVAYSPLLNGSYGREDKPLDPGYQNAGTAARQAALAEVAAETGATPNQVVLAWLIGGEVPVIPLVGASSVAQLDDSLAAVDLDLTPEQRAKLDAAN
ncbi:aldo/keto reductase [Streptomyces beijiangensis]|uniref:Aldo/keto reductase n=1 Tax=Streptomyces beijiangensis TaxID=163361 RepID=A0A939FD60_9ACTN|nr:aldo/keto reductase [Streptomyces beijiangensis]MBO0515247.1 aldo/keto reductase [Streptomyces beijiangensis]